MVTESPEAALWDPCAGLWKGEKRNGLGVRSPCAELLIADTSAQNSINSYTGTRYVYNTHKTID